MNVRKILNGGEVTRITQREMVAGRVYECVEFPRYSSRNWLGTLVALFNNYKEQAVIIASNDNNHLSPGNGCIFSNEYKFVEVPKGTVFEVTI